VTEYILLDICRGRVVSGITRQLRRLIRRLIDAHVVDAHAIGEDEILEAGQDA
jgi:hypothetical protein